MIEDGKDLGFTATIPQNRYEQLLDLETRADVAVERMTNDEYCKIETILRILGFHQPCGGLMKSERKKESGMRNI